MNTKPEDRSGGRGIVGLSRRSTFAVSTLPVCELKVGVSTTLPESTCLSLVRTTVLPLPGLCRCWNQTTDHELPVQVQHHAVVEIIRRRHAYLPCSLCLLIGSRPGYTHPASSIETMLKFRADSLDR